MAHLFNCAGKMENATAFARNYALVALARLGRLGLTNRKM